MPPIPLKVIDDLADRLRAAANSLDRLASKATSPAKAERLTAKADGVRLAQSYVRELRNDWTQDGQTIVMRGQTHD